MRRGLAVLLLVACGASAPAPAAGPPPPPPPAADPAPEPAAAPPKSDDLGFCVEETNRYRKKAGKPPLRRSADLEDYAAEGAAADTRTRRPHGHFSKVAYPHPYRGLGENVIPWWPLAQYGSVKEIIRAGLAGMWGEGPGGGHYENLVGEFTEVGCGIFISNGEVTVTQDFLLPPEPRRR